MISSRIYITFSVAAVLLAVASASNYSKDYSSHKHLCFKKIEKCCYKFHKCGYETKKVDDKKKCTKKVCAKKCVKVPYVEKKKECKHVKVEVKCKEKSYDKKGYGYHTNSYDKKGYGYDTKSYDKKGYGYDTHSSDEGYGDDTYSYDKGYGNHYNSYDKKKPCYGYKKECYYKHVTKYRQKCKKVCDHKHFYIKIHKIFKYAKFCPKLVCKKLAVHYPTKPDVKVSKKGIFVSSEGECKKETDKYVPY